MRFLIFKILPLCLFLPAVAHADTFTYSYFQTQNTTFKGSVYAQQVTFSYVSPTLITGSAIFTPDTCQGPGSASAGYETCGKVTVQLDPAFSDSVMVALTPLPQNRDSPTYPFTQVSPYNLLSEGAYINPKSRTAGFVPGTYGFTNSIQTATLTITRNVVATPEPATVSLTGTGLALLAMTLWTVRRRRTRLEQPL